MKQIKQLALLAVIFMSSCASDEMNKVKDFASSQNSAFPIIKIRECEYIFCDVDKANSNYGNVVLVHCGDCSNPIHKHQ